MALFEIMPSKFSIAHEIRTSRWGRRLRPRSVNEYSTLGGTAGYNFLEMRPSSVSVLSVAVSIFFLRNVRDAAVHVIEPQCTMLFKSI